MLSIPVVSIIIPTYNRGAAIRETIESVLTQTIVADLEIIVVDDGSEDNTLSFLQNEYSNNAQIRVVNQKNAGVAVARNRGLQEARGDFIAFLDHDDLWLPQKLEKQLAAFQNRDKVDVVTCDWQNFQTEVPAALISSTRCLPTGNVYRRFLNRNHIVSMSVPLIRARALENVRFDPQTQPSDDWDLWLRLARVGQFENVPEVLVFYRVHKDQQSGNSAKMLASMKRVFRKQLPFARRKPLQRLLIFASIRFADSHELYVQAKNAWFESRNQELLKVIAHILLRYPLALLSPGWLYLWKRILQRQRQPF